MTAPTCKECQAAGRCMSRGSCAIARYHEQQEARGAVVTRVEPAAAAKAPTKAPAASHRAGYGTVSVAEVLARVEKDGGHGLRPAEVQVLAAEVAGLREVLRNVLQGVKGLELRLSMRQLVAAGEEVEELIERVSFALEGAGE